MSIDFSLKKPKQEKEKIKIRYKKDSPSITIMVAMSQNGCLGSKNSIPWKLRNDMKRFKEYTLNKPILMGINTFDSLPFLLKDRLTIVLSRDFAKVKAVIARHKQIKPDIIVPEIVHFESLEELRGMYSAIVQKYGKQYDCSELVICGGAQIYDQFIDFADKVLVTEVKANIDGDTYWPRDGNLSDFIDNKEWQTSLEKSFFKDEFNEYDYRFYTFVRPGQATLVSLKGKCEITKLDRVAIRETTGIGNGNTDKSAA